MKRALSVCLVLTLLAVTGVATLAQDSSQPQATTAKTPHSNGMPSAGDIAAAKAAHKVWVNLDTGIYHRGGHWYGKTKDGKFMTLEEAKKAGYKAAK